MADRPDWSERTSMVTNSFLLGGALDKDPFSDTNLRLYLYFKVIPLWSQSLTDMSTTLEFKSRLAVLC